MSLVWCLHQFCSLSGLWAEWVVEHLIECAKACEIPGNARGTITKHQHLQHAFHNTLLMLLLSPQVTVSLLHHAEWQYTIVAQCLYSLAAQLRYSTGFLFDHIPTSAHCVSSDVPTVGQRAFEHSIDPVETEAALNACPCLEIHVSETSRVLTTQDLWQQNCQAPYLSQATLHYCEKLNNLNAFF